MICSEIDIHVFLRYVIFQGCNESRGDFWDWKSSEFLTTLDTKSWPAFVQVVFWELDTALHY